METLKEIYFDVMALLALVWVLAHLILIEIYGVIQICESNPWIL